MKATIEQNKDGYGIYLQHGEYLITSMGETMSELLQNFNEALELTLEGETSKEAESLRNWKPQFVIDMTYFPELFPAIDVSGLARYIGINPSLMRQYMSGIKKPSVERYKKINKGIHDLGRHYQQTVFDY